MVEGGVCLGPIVFLEVFLYIGEVQLGPHAMPLPVGWTESFVRPLAIRKCRVVGWSTAWSMGSKQGFPRVGS